VATYRLRPAAREDLEEIWDYTLREWSVEQALNYTDELEATIDLICESPTMCRERNEFVPPVRINPRFSSIETGLSRLLQVIGDTRHQAYSRV